MSERVLLASGNGEWREAIAIALAGYGCEVMGTDGSDLTQAALEFDPASVVFDADFPTTRPDLASSPSILQTLILEFRKDFASKHALIIAPAPSEKLSALTAECVPADLILDRGADCAGLAAEVLATIKRLRPAVGPNAAPELATIEIELYLTYVECKARVGPHSRSFGPLKWQRREAELIDAHFKLYESDDELFKSNVHRHFLDSIGKRLLWNVFESPLKEARRFCGQYLPLGGTILHRFVTGDGDLEFVPFELVATENDGEYLRGVHPIVRKLTPRQPHRNPNRALRRDGAGNRVLLISAKVNGSMTIPGHLFKKRQPARLGPLNHLRDELRRVKSECKKRGIAVTSLSLAARNDNLKKITSALQAGPFDVVHFAGHSVRSDTTGQVFLALPGMATGQIVPFDADEFARLCAEADARLVILSSCEGASCRALSRMASFGVPAVAGFRWPVVDGDAAIFTPALHEALREDGRSVRMASAFHNALRNLKASAKDELTWLSPVIMLQRSAWDEYSLEA